MKPRSHTDDLRRVREAHEQRAGVRYHLTAEQRKRAAARPSPHKRGYDRRWQKLRRMLLRTNPTCEACARKEPPEVTPATEVDHIVALAKGGARLDVANLQALCKACHARKTVREDGGFGAPAKGAPPAL